MTASTVLDAGDFLPRSVGRGRDGSAKPIAGLVDAWRRPSWPAIIGGAGRLAQAALAHVASMVSQARPRAATDRARDEATDASEIRFQRDIVTQLDAAYNFARFLSRDADAAQDIVQEAFLRAYRGFGSYQGGDPRAWIFAIVRNCYHDWLLERRRKARLEVHSPASSDGEERMIEDVASDEDDPETALLRRSDAGRVRTVLTDLPRPLREILVLREIEGLSYRQIAEIAGLPIGTVMSRLARARTQFQAAWRRASGLEEPTS